LDKLTDNENAQMSRFMNALRRYATWLPIFCAQVFFAGAVWPYVSGEVVFAPAAYLSEGGLRSASTIGRDLTPRDKFGAQDFLDQERNFLRFYRESLSSGHLPFWNERNFGGVSQEDSMIFSYLSPFHLPWLLTEDDHVAKGWQIYLLLNLGAIAVFWWCRILGVGPAWTLLSIVLVTLNPLSLHYQAHTHQPALYFAGLLALASFYQYLQEGKRAQLLVFFGIVCAAIAMNFLSAMLFISIALAVLGGVYFIRVPDGRAVTLVRSAQGAAAFLLAVITLAFFLGPILLESHLVREPVLPRFQSYAPWDSATSLIDSLSVVNTRVRSNCDLFATFHSVVPTLLSRDVIFTKWGLSLFVLFEFVCSSCDGVSMRGVRQATKPIRRPNFVTSTVGGRCQSIEFSVRIGFWRGD